MGKSEKITLTDKQQNWLIKHYKHTKNAEIREKLGLSHATLHRIARELSLKKSKQFMKMCQENTTRAAWAANKLRGWPPKGYRIPNADKAGFKKGVTSLQRLGPEREAERLRKSAESRRKTVAAEKRRVLFGLPQKTKIKIGYSRKKVCYRHALRRRGYLVDRGGGEAYVCESTVRNEVVEQRAAKYGIRIVV